MSRAPHLREEVHVLGLLALQARLGHRRPRRVAQLAEPAHPVDLPQRARVEQAVDLVDLARLEVERVRQQLAHALVRADADLQPDRLAEAPAAQLRLDGLQEVVGLVGDLEVGVAGDAEDRVTVDLHPGEERIEVRRDDLLQRDERVRLGVERDEARQHLRRHLHAGERARVGDRIADEHRERQRQARDVRERATGPDGERRQGREDLAAEALRQLAAPGLVEVVDGERP